MQGLTIAGRVGGMSPSQQRLEGRISWPNGRVLPMRMGIIYDSGEATTSSACA